MDFTYYHVKCTLVLNRDNRCYWKPPKTYCEMLEPSLQISDTISTSSTSEFVRRMSGKETTEIENHLF